MPDMKDVQNQGSTYEESSTEVLGDAAPKIPKKALYIGIAFIIIGIIAILVYTYVDRSNAGKDPDPSISDPMEVEILDTSYTPEEVKQLRAAGYTGDEIENFQTQNADFTYLLTTAKEEQTIYLEKLYAELSAESMTSASPEFKELLDKTWLGGPAREVFSEDVMHYSTEVVKEIVDYVKLPPRGTQLFLMLTMNDGQKAFISMHPSRWSQLKDSGNVVVTYDLVTFGLEKFIMNLVEVQV